MMILWTWVHTKESLKTTKKYIMLDGIYSDIAGYAKLKHFILHNFVAKKGQAPASSIILKYITISISVSMVYTYNDQ